MAAVYQPCQCWISGVSEKPLLIHRRYGVRDPAESALGWLMMCAGYDPPPIWQIACIARFCSSIVPVRIWAALCGSHYELFLLPGLQLPRVT